MRARHSPIPWPRRVWVPLAIGSLLAAALVQVATSPRYPDEDDVNAVLGGLDTQSSTARRASLRRMVNRLSHVDGLFDGHEDAVRHDRIAEGALRSLVDAYRARPHPEILDALDAVTLDGGFANHVCSAYARLLAEEPARVRYRLDRAPLRRCHGITFDEAELTRLLDVRGGTAHPRGQAPPGP